MAFREINEPRNPDARREPESSVPPSPQPKSNGDLKRNISTMRMRIADIFKEGKDKANGE